MKSVSNSRESKLRPFRIKVIALSIVCLGVASAAHADTDVHLNPFVVSSSLRALSNDSKMAEPVTTDSIRISRPVRLPIVDTKAGDPSNADSNQRSAVQRLLLPESDSIIQDDVQDEVVMPPTDMEFPMPPTASMDASRGESPGPSDWPATPSEDPAPEYDTIEASDPEPSTEARNVLGQDSWVPAGWPVSEAMVPSVDAWPIANEEQQANKESQAGWLRSTTSLSTHEQARGVLDQAITEYSVGAFASAEDSAWRSLRLIAEAIDMDQRRSGSIGEPAMSAVKDLWFARTAIRESRDFLSLSRNVDADAVKRIAMSHQTNLIEAEDVFVTDCRDLGDRYLDEARTRLSRIATRSDRAAEAMDLLAAVYLGRNEENLVPGPTALCMRRAALQGQPENASLASRLGLQLAHTGLHEEAYMVLTHAYELEPDVEISNALERVAIHCGKHTPRFASRDSTAPKMPSTKVPDVIQLSPSEFAAISKPVIQVAAMDGSGIDFPSNTEKLGGKRTNPAIAEGTAEEPAVDETDEGADFDTATTETFDDAFLEVDAAGRRLRNKLPSHEENTCSMNTTQRIILATALLVTTTVTLTAVEPSADTVSLEDAAAAHSGDATCGCRLVPGGYPCQGACKPCMTAVDCATCCGSEATLA